MDLDLIFLVSFLPPYLFANWFFITLGLTTYRRMQKLYQK